MSNYAGIIAAITEHLDMEQILLQAYLIKCLSAAVIITKRVHSTLWHVQKKARVCDALYRTILVEQSSLPMHTYFFVTTTCQAKHRS